MAGYRYLLGDLLTNAILAELPLTGVQFSRELNQAGSLSGSLLFTDDREDVYSIATTTTPGRTCLYVDRDGVIVWGGVVWSRSYSSDGQRLTFQAREFLSYWEKRRITDTVVAQDEDQLTVAETLVDQIQGKPSGDIGVVVTPATSGINITRTYNGYELKPLYEALLELSRFDDGFDFSIDVAYDDDFNIVKTLNLDYPRRGEPYSEASVSALVLEFPGNVISYQFPEDGAGVANYMYGIGQGQGAEALRSEQEATGQLANGWPLLEQSISYTDINDQAVLDGVTNATLQVWQDPITVIECVTEGYNYPLIGTFDTGDDVRLVIRDPRFRNGYDSVWRVAGYSITPGEAGPERVSWRLYQPTPGVGGYEE